MTGSCSNALSPFEDDRKPPAKGRTPYFASPDDDASVSSRIDVEAAVGTVLHTVKKTILIVSIDTQKTPA